MDGFSRFRIDHVGSTSVPGLGGKGIIDMLVSIPDWNNRQQYVKALRKIGFGHIHPDDKHRIFMSRVKRTKRGDVHLHLVKAGTREMRRHFVFRDFLRRNKKYRDEYWQHKLWSLKQTGGVRDKFGKVKRVLVEKIEARAYKKLKVR